MGIFMMTVDSMDWQRRRAEELFLELQGNYVDADPDAVRVEAMRQASYEAWDRYHSMAERRSDGA